MGQRDNSTKKVLIEFGGKIVESKKDEKSGKISYPVVIISQGLGNLADKNYYTKQAIESGVAVYEGKKAYFDHPTATQSMEQPGRSVRETCGHYENCRAEKDESGLMVLKADFAPEKGNADLIAKLDHAVEFKKKYPDKEYIGISINGDGEGKEFAYEDFIKEFKPSTIEMEKIIEVEGEAINAIIALTEAVSADLVTEPGAKGRFLLESKNKHFKKTRRTKMLESMKKFLFGVEKGDKKLMEEAAKDMLQQEGEAAKEAEANMEAEAASMAKGMLQWKKENAKKDDEAEEAYEARAMKQCMKQSAEAKKEAAAKMEAEKGEKEKAEKEAKEKKEKEEAEAKAKAEKDAKEAASKDHPDADKDKELIKKMMADQEALKKENEELKKESKKHSEESAMSKIALKAKEKSDLVDTVLAESGLQRSITKELRPLLEKASTKEEMKKLVDTAKKVYSEGIESAFIGAADTGFTEIATEEGAKQGSTDHLF